MRIFLIIATIVSVLTSCQKFLDKKPDKSFATPASLEDLQAILDNYNTLNRGSGANYISADEYYLLYSVWDPLPNPDRDGHIWTINTQFEKDWNDMYKIVFFANTVLDNLNHVNYGVQLERANSIKGSALFFRAWAFFQLSQIFAEPYDTDADKKLGLPLRIKSDFSVTSVRSTLQQTYDQIIRDLEEAIVNLPNTQLYPTRPNKAAAYGLLAKTYLVMRDYLKAKENANSYLQLYSTLMDYNDPAITSNASATPPFKRFNAEVIFHSTVSSQPAMTNSRAKIDSVLVAMYSNNDWRRTLFFRNNSDNSKAFKGNYEQSASNYFNGIATDEIYLIKAECEARTGDYNIAISTLNALLVKRWKTGTFVPETAANATEALNKVLLERKKELLYRGTRWSDLRRLNKEGNNITLTRKLNNQVYTLAPNDLRYTLLIPQSVINLSGMAQNSR